MRKALVIGINDYPSAPLSGCVPDAHAIANVLETHGDGSPNFAVKLITCPPDVVTRASLRKACEELFEGECDIALLYFSGHGLIKSTGGYVVTPDYRSYDEGVSMNELLSLANKSKSRSRVIILDCCHSGAFGTPSMDGSQASQLNEGLTVLTASRASEAAMETGGSGVFTALVEDALKGGAADLRGYITPGGIYSYVDQALGPWDQRPIFKTNVTQFLSIRNITPQVPFTVLRKICEYFPNPQDQFALSPAHEETSGTPDPLKVSIFKDLQKLERVGLLVPVGEEYMYYAAMNSRSCRLTAMGYQYWRLAKEKKI